jgi:uncharacterized membrane protein
MDAAQVPAANGRLSARLRRVGAKRAVLAGLMVAGAAAISHVWYRGSQIDSHTYGPDELEQGPVAQVIAWGDNRTAVQISRLSSLPADHLWRVVTDQGRFDQFMPYVRSTTVEPLPDGTLRERQILDLPHASYELQLLIRLSEKGLVRTANWTQAQGTLSYNQGAWIVERAGERAVLRYQVSAGLDWVPQWLVNYAMRRRLGRLLEAVETRVRDLERREPEYFRS